MKRVLAALLLTLGCTGGTEPPAPARLQSGTYALTHVNGNPVPYELSAQGRDTLVSLALVVDGDSWVVDQVQRGQTGTAIFHYGASVVWSGTVFTLREPAGSVWYTNGQVDGAVLTMTPTVSDGAPVFPQMTYRLQRK